MAEGDQMIVRHSMSRATMLVLGALMAVMVTSCGGQATESDVSSAAPSPTSPSPSAASPTPTASTTASESSSSRPGPSPTAPAVSSECILALSDAADADRLAAEVAGLTSDFMPGGERDDTTISEALGIIQDKRDELASVVADFAQGVSGCQGAPEVCAAAVEHAGDLIDVATRAADGFTARLEAVGGVLADGPEGVDDAIDEMDQLSEDMDTIVEDRAAAAGDFYPAQEDCEAQR